jgi:hypothetical protein
MNKPPLGWRTHDKLVREFRQGETQSRWSERRFLILMAEYRLNCRRELVAEFDKAGGDGLEAGHVIAMEQLEHVCDHPE